MLEIRNTPQRFVLNLINYPKCPVCQNMKNTYLFLYDVFIFTWYIFKAIATMIILIRNNKKEVKN